MTDPGCDRHRLEQAVAAAVAGGVDWIQVRDRSLDGAALLALTERLAGAARRASDGVRVVVNRRADVALATGADGIHLGFDAMDPGCARRLLGEEALVGVSCHEPRELDAARKAGAGYAHLAPVFDPLSKGAERPALGLAPLERAAAAGLPVLAQGGITAANAGAVRAAGAAGVAVTGAILLAEDPRAAAAALRRALERRESR